MRIDTTKWAEFVVGQLFDHIESAKGVNSQQLVDGDDIAYIAASKDNNGLKKYVQVEKFEDWVSKGNCITFVLIGDGAAGCAHYQKEDFIAMNGKISCGYIQDYLNEYTGNFLASILSKNHEKFSFKEGWTGDNLLHTKIKLPVDRNGNPDWKYMENYMKSVEKKVCANLSNFYDVSNNNVRVKVANRWQPFVVGDYFRVVKGKRLTKANMLDGTTRFIGASAQNNGVTHLIGNTENVHSDNVITVAYNGSVGETFYQDEKFIASDDVNVFYPKANFNKYIALFIAPILRQIGKSKYAFVDKWKKEDMETEIIRLPVDVNGQPDWKYMENYMKQIEKKVQHNLQCLQRVV